MRSKRINNKYLNGLLIIGIYFIIHNTKTSWIRYHTKYIIDRRWEKNNIKLKIDSMIREEFLCIPKINNQKKNEENC